MMETFASRKIVFVFCLFVCIVLNDLSAPVHSSSESSQTMTVEEFGDSKEDGGSSVEEAAAADSGGKEGGLGVPHHHHHQHHHHPNVEEDDARVSLSSLSTSSRGSVLEVSDDDVEDGNKDGDGDGDGGEEETVQFSAAISERKTQQQPTPCRRHRRAVTFDTITTPMGGTTLHYSPHTATFTAPFSGLYLFSVNIQHRHSHRRPPPDDVHIVAALPDMTQTIVCSISAQNGDIPDLDSVSLNSRQENVEYRDDLNFAKWGFEDASRRNMDWSRPPRSPWKRNLETRDVEGFCEGVRHLLRGQEVFVRLGNLHKGLMEGADDNDVNVDKKENVCDITGGFFSGSLLTRDI